MKAYSQWMCTVTAAMSLFAANVPAAAFNPDWGSVGVFSAATACSDCHRASADQDPSLPAVMRDPLQDNGADISPYTQWRHSVMAHALDDPYYRATVEDEATVLPALAGFIEDKCLTCHAPMAHTNAHQTGVDLAQDASCTLPDGCYRLDTAEVQDHAREGTSCTLCHQIRDEGLGSDDSFSGGYKIAAAGDTGDFTIYGPYQNPHQGGANSMMNRSGYTPVYGQQVTGSAHCATCHTLYTPVIEIDTGTATDGEFLEQGAFLEWQNSVYVTGAREAQECQDCHMPDPAPGAYSTRISVLPDGSVNEIWPERMPFFTHSMVGGNTYLLELLRDYRAALGIEGSTSVDGFNQQISLTRDLLQTATATLAITDVQALNGELEISVRITNHSGHKLPTGFPSRRMWIHLAVTDPSNRLIFASGAPDAAGEISTDTARLAADCMAPVKPPGFDSSACYEPHRDSIDAASQIAIYETALADTNDDITHILLYADHYLKDNRIPPEGFTNNRADVIEPQTRPAGIGNDADFNRDANGEGSSTDTVHYRVPMTDTNGRYTVDAQLLYQAIQPAFVHGLSSDTARVNTFKTLYRDNPPTIEALATDNASLDVAGSGGSSGGGGGGGCTLHKRTGTDPLIPLAMLVMLCYRQLRRRQEYRHTRSHPHVLANGPYQPWPIPACRTSGWHSLTAINREDDPDGDQTGT